MITTTAEGGRAHADRRTAQAAAARRHIDRRAEARKGRGKGGRRAWKREL